jgi:hypothetical protein
MRQFNRIRRDAALCVFLLLAGLSLCESARAAPTPDALTGFYYEHESAPTTWDSARANAADRMFGSAPGHLITITSERENLISRYLGGIGEKHIGLTDATGVSMVDGFDYATLGTTEAGNTSGSPLPAAGNAPTSGERGFGFRWITGEPFTYQKWNAAEPNNAFGNEDGVRNGQAGTWLDIGIGTTVGELDVLRGYLVEYNTILAQERFSILERRPAATFNSGNVNTLAQAIRFWHCPSAMRTLHPKQRAKVLSSVSTIRTGAAGWRILYARRT